MKPTRKKAKLALLAALVIIMAPAFVRAYTINGPSMAPTLHKGDLVLALLGAYDLRLPYTDRVVLRVAEPRRGDVLLYHDTVKETVAVKRVVGLPGDTIELRRNQLFVNGAVVEQTAATLPSGQAVPENLGEVIANETIDGRQHPLAYTPGRSEQADHGPVEVPPDRYFLLGDHRDNSQDSRFIGCITRDQIKGRIFYGTRQPYSRVNAALVIRRGSILLRHSSSACSSCDIQIVCCGLSEIRLASSHDRHTAAP